MIDNSCPLCHGTNIQLLSELNKKFYRCLDCNCQAPKDMWDKHKPQYKLIGYYCVVDGETKFTKDKKIAGAWYDFGHNVNALFEKDKK